MPEENKIEVKKDVPEKKELPKIETKKEELVKVETKKEIVKEEVAIKNELKKREKKEAVKEKPVEKKEETKEVDKKEVKEKAIEKKTEKKKVEVQKPKEKKKPKAVNKIKKTEEQKKLQAKIKQKKVPTIRGNFGKMWLRRKSIPKWNKWHKARGIDFFLKKEDGARPKMGYRTTKKVRGLHPSGLKEVYVNNLNELKEIKEKNVVIRLKRTIGKKAKKEILKTAKEMNLRILN